MIAKFIVPLTEHRRLTRLTITLITNIDVSRIEEGVGSVAAVGKPRRVTTSQKGRATVERVLFRTPWKSVYTRA